MAQIFLLNIHAKLIKYLKNIIFSEDFKKTHRTSETAFTRRRILTFPLVIFGLINFFSASIQTELNGMFQSILGTKVPVHVVSQPAFSQARLKLCFEAFIKLNFFLTRYFYRYFSIRRWAGFRVIAADTATLLLPSDPETRQLFGVVPKSEKRRKSKKCLPPMLRVSQLFDVLNDVTLDAVTAFYDWSERNILVSHAERLSKGDLVLLDRGYPAFWIFSLLRSKKARFCARVPLTTNLVKSFVASGLKEKIVFLYPTPASSKTCRDLGLPEKPIRVRLVRVELDSGNVEVLITDLLDAKRFPRDVFADLYALRWGVEEDFKRLKSRLKIGKLSGKTLQSTLQDIHAKVFVKNLTSILTKPIQEEIEAKDGDETPKHKLNFAQTYATMKNTVVLLFLESRPEELLSELFDTLRKAFLRIRPGRRYPRNHKKPKAHSYSY